MNMHIIAARILLIITATLPIAHLYMWENHSLFDSPLTHRIWITWCELAIISLTIAIIPFNIFHDIKNDKPLSAVLFLWLACGYLSILFSENPYASTVRQVEISIHILFAYCIIKTLGYAPTGKYLIYGVIVAFLYSLFYILLLALAAGEKEYPWTTGIPFFSNIRHWGYLQVIALPLSYYMILSKNTKIYGLAAFTLIWASIFWAGGRGTFLTACIISLLVFPWILKPKLKIYLTSLILIGLALILSIITDVNHPSLSIKHLFYLKEGTTGYTSINSFSAGRIGIYLDSIKQILNESFLFGLGPDNFRYTTPPIHIMATHPHSFLIQIFYSNGLTGLVLTGLLGLIILNKVKRSTTLTNKILMLTLISALGASAVDGVFYHSYSLFCLMLIIALSIHESSPLKMVNSNKNKWPALIFALSATPLLIVWLIHSQTYWQYQKPLETPQQLAIIHNFPSIILSQNWLHNDQNKTLVIESLIIGSQYSDNQCGHLLMLDLKYQHDANQQISQNCHPSILRHSMK